MKKYVKSNSNYSEDLSMGLEPKKIDRQSKVKSLGSNVQDAINSKNNELQEEFRDFDNVLYVYLPDMVELVDAAKELLRIIKRDKSTYNLSKFTNAFCRNDMCRFAVKMKNGYPSEIYGIFNHSFEMYDDEIHYRFDTNNPRQYQLSNIQRFLEYFDDFQDRFDRFVDNYKPYFD